MEVELKSDFPLN